MTITIPVKFEADGTDLEREINKTVGSGSKASKALKSAALPATAALTGLAGAAFKFAGAAADDAKAQALLAQALRASGGAGKEQIAFAEEFVTSMSKAAAVSDDELRPALAALVRGTGDVRIAQRALKTALDVSAATGKPLATVSAAIAKGYGGQTSALGRLIPNLDKAALKSGDMDVIMGQLADKTLGAAAEAANSTAGKMEGMRIQMGEAQESIGTALLPALTGLATTLASVATFIQDNTELVLILGGVIGGLAATVLITNGVLAAYGAVMTVVSGIQTLWSNKTKIATAVQAAFNAVLAANPIGLVVLAIAALVVGLVIAYKKSQTFRNIVNAVFHSVAEVAKTVFGAIVAAANFVWDVLKTGVKAVSVVFKIYFGVIKAVVTTVFGAVKSIISTFIGFAKTAAGKIGGFFEGIWDGVAGAAKAAFSGVISIVNVAIRGINKVIDGINKIPKVDIPHVPELSGFAKGTTFAPGGLALVGEQGPELVTLPRGSRVDTASRTREILSERATSVTVAQNFYGPTTGADRLQELDWTLRYATGRTPVQSTSGVGA